jgi:redox-sensitive bicupin YhaK (pirin superfamily)
MMNSVQTIQPSGVPWTTMDPFIFCVYHLDRYPRANKDLGPAASLRGRSLGNDFFLRDGWRMYHGHQVPGFPVHPHRGFETITFVLKGFVDHSDSNGAAGRYGYRDVQWMTAGSGLQHSEMFPLLNEEEENTLELFQIWLNLPASKKFAKPCYKMLWDESVPRLKVNDKNQNKTEIDLIAGEIGEVAAPAPAPDSWAADPENEVAIWHISMEENAEWEIPQAKENVNRSLYFFEGKSVFLNDKKMASGNVVVLNPHEKVILKNSGTRSRLLLLQGKPINEPVVQYGPFVMNNQEEIRQAFADYRETEFGGWPWPRRDMVHGKQKKRFARLINGEEIFK